MKYLKYVFILFILFSNFSVVYGNENEVLILKNGLKVEGKIIERTDEYIKINFQGSEIRYYMDEIEFIEKTIPAIIVKDEKEKQKLKQKLMKTPGTTIYDLDVNEDGSVNVEMTDTTEVIKAQQAAREELDAPGKPLGNTAIQFKSLADMAQEEEDRINNMTDEERAAYEKRKEAAERFYREF